MLEGETRVLQTSTSHGRIYHRFLLTIPNEIARDSQFPFEGGEQLAIEVKPSGSIILSKLPKKEQTPRGTKRPKLGVKRRRVTYS